MVREPAAVVQVPGGVGPGKSRWGQVSGRAGSRRCNATAKPPGTVGSGARSAIMTTPCQPGWVAVYRVQLPTTRRPDASAACDLVRMNVEESVGSLSRKKNFALGRLLTQNDSPKATSMS